MYGMGTIGYLYGKNENWILTSHHTKKSQFQVNHRLKLKNETIMLLEDNTDKYLHDLMIGTILSKTKKRKKSHSLQR